MARGFARIIVTVYVSHATGSVKIIQSNYGLCKDYTVHVSLAMNFVKTIQSMYHWLRVYLSLAKDVAYVLFVCCKYVFRLQERSGGVGGRSSFATTRDARSSRLLLWCDC